MARQSEIPEFSLGREFVQGLYRPELIPEDLDLNNFITSVDEEEIVQQSLQSKMSAVSVASATDALVPLTEAEAKEADKQIEDTRERIRVTRDKINLIRSRIDDNVAASRSGSGGGELSFKMDISRKPRLRRAIKRLFGRKTDQITYSMYKAMLKAKSELEKEEANVYTSGVKNKEDSKNDKKGGDKGGKQDKKKDKKDKKKKKGFLQRNADQEELDNGAQDEESYERLFAKIGRDFVYKEDLYKMMDGFADILDPDGLGILGGDNRSDSEARKRAREYRGVIDSGKDGTDIYKDLINMDDDEDEV
jgi:hypothetical protein